MLRVIAVALLVLSAPDGATAQWLSGPELQREVSGNTLTGYNTSGVFFSEYHSPDGRVFGHNNGERVVEGCWAVRDNAVCYYYAKGRLFAGGTFCWRMERAGADGYRIASVERDTTGAARRDQGNPRNHDDEGKPWVCEGLVSEAPSGKGLAGEIRHRFAAAARR